jgi:hypothetical protein
MNEKVKINKNYILLNEKKYLKRLKMKKNKVMENILEYYDIDMK